MAEAFATETVKSFAQGVVTDLAKSLLGKLGSVAVQQFCLAWALEDDLKRLKKYLLAINEVLLDAENQDSDNKKVQFWLQMLQEAMYDAEDMLDEFECESLRRKVVKTTGSSSRKVRRFFSSSNPLLFRLRMGLEIKNLVHRFAEIETLKSELNLNKKPIVQITHALLPGEIEMNPSSESFTGFIGREQERKHIINLLLDNGKIDNANLSIIPIIGMAGLGKTAFAKSVCDDERVQNHFQLQLQVCVSDGFDLKQVVAKIIRFVTGKKCIDQDINELLAKLEETLGGKKYLLLLDDVWNEDPEKWLLLEHWLSKGSIGSKIIVTTRSNRAAEIMGTVPAYNLSLLDEQDCLSLFLRCAFREGQEKHYLALVKIGEQIARKCKQIPLAVVSLGTQLFKNTDEKEWKRLRDNEMWELEKDGGILPALRISYQRLPSHLKRCFLHCAIFPKGYQFTNIALVQFWIAHGLIQSSSRGELEDFGHRYLVELMSKNFFQEIHDFTVLVAFKMHDLMHDLALSLFRNECSIITSENLQISESARHLTFLDSESFSQAVPMFPDRLNRVRTVLSTANLEGPSCKKNVEKCLSKSKHLRAVEFDVCDFEVLPQKIGTLKQIRYLNFSDNTKMRRLPKSVLKLQNLQALLLAEGFDELPQDVRYLINLRFLFFSTKQKVLQKGGIGCLEALQTLYIGSSENLEHLFPDMQGLKSLRKLWIFDCKSLISLPRSMNYLTALESLCIGACENLDLSTMEEVEMQEQVEEPDQLSLQLLLIARLPATLALPTQLLQRSANSMRTLLLEGCPHIRELPECIRSLTLLRRLGIAYCPTLSARCQKETGEDWHKIAHVPNIFVDQVYIQSDSA